MEEQEAAWDHSLTPSERLQVDSWIPGIISALICVVSVLRKHGLRFSLHAPHRVRSIIKAMTFYELGSNHMCLQGLSSATSYGVILLHHQRYWEG